MEAKLSTSLNDLIDSGLVTVPLQLYGTLDGHQFEVTLQADGSLISNGRTFNSLSVAAGSLITAKTGKTSANRSYYACNGWKFWHIRDAGGKLVEIDEIRDQLPKQ